MYSVGSAEWIHTISDKALSSSPQTSVTLTEAIWVFEEGALCVRTAFLWKRMWVIHGACQAEKYISHLHVCERERQRLGMVMLKCFWVFYYARVLWICECLYVTRAVLTLYQIFIKCSSNISTSNYCVYTHNRNTAIPQIAIVYK